MGIKTQDLAIYRLIARELEIKVFEQWVYSQESLEDFLGPDSYLDLMSLDYSLPSSLNDAEAILKPYINIGCYYEWSLRRILQKVIDRPSDVSKYIKQCYDLYCDGYGFLDNLGLGYGLAIAVPPSEYGADTWNALDSSAQKKLTDSLYPGVRKAAEQVVHWLDTQKIVLTGHDGTDRGIEYNDNRTAAEKSPRATRCTVNPQSKP